MLPPAAPAFLRVISSRRSLQLAGAGLLLLAPLACHGDRRTAAVAPNGAPRVTSPTPHAGTLEESFTVVKGLLHEGTMLDFPTQRRTLQYAPLQLPKAPVLHAYHPLETSAGSGVRPGFVAAAFTLNFKLPGRFYKALPGSVRALLKKEGVSPRQVDILCVSQNYIYDGTTPASGQYLLRPHYWADPEAPQTGTHSTSFRVGVALLEQDPDIHFVGHGPEACFQADISIHPESEDPCAPIVSSPGNLAIAGLTPGVTRGFWSVTRIGDRAAATLHLLFNDSDQETLEQVAGTARTFPQLLDGLDATPALAGSRPVQMLKSLFRPVIKVPKVPVQAKAPARSEEPNAGAAETRV